MKPFGKLLVPIDFSTSSSEAIEVAADLSRRYDASVTLVHVYQPVAYPFPEGFVLYTADQMAGMLTELKKALDAAVRSARAAGADRVTGELVQGVVASEVVSIAERDGYDLIVMGTHGRTGLQHALLGSVAEKVVRRAPCPVLTVRGAPTISAEQDVSPRHA